MGMHIGAWRSVSASVCVHVYIYDVHGYVAQKSGVHMSCMHGVHKLIGWKLSSGNMTLILTCMGDWELFTVRRQGQQAATMNTWVLTVAWALT